MKDIVVRDARNNPFQRPPIGIKPRYIHEEERRIEIQKAIMRTMNAAGPIPAEWIAEYNELAKRRTKIER